MFCLFLLFFIQCIPLLLRADSAAADSLNSNRIYFPEEIREDAVFVLGDSGKTGMTFSLSGEYGISKTSERQYLSRSIRSRFTKPAWAVVTQQIERIHDDHREGETQSLKADCYIVTADKNVRKAWSVKEEAAQGMLNDFYEVIQKGCCSLQDNHKLYSVKKGRLVLETTADLLKIEVPGTGLNRFIGYKASETFNQADYERDKLYAGTISYASEDSTIQRIVIRAASKEDRDKYFGMGYGKISFTEVKKGDEITSGNSLLLWNAGSRPDAKGIDGFSVRVEFFGGYSVEAAVKNDSLIIVNKEQPHYTIEYLPEDKR